jgi:hypothetical protein
MEKCKRLNFAASPESFAIILKNLKMPHQLSVISNIPIRNGLNALPLKPYSSLPFGFHLSASWN